MRTGCPPAPDLLDLLDLQEAPAPSVIALRAHVETCAACAAELQALRAGFTALDPAALVLPDAVVMQRMERAVLAEVRQGAALPSWQRLLLGGLLAAALVMLLGAPFGRLLQGATLLRAGGLLALPLLLLLGLRTRRAALWAGLALPWALAVAMLGTQVDASLIAHSGCLPLALLGALAGGLVLSRTAGRLGRSASGGLALGVGAGVCGLAMQVALCGEHGVDHVLLLHLLPVVAITGLSGALGWYAGRAPAASVLGARG